MNKLYLFLIILFVLFLNQFSYSAPPPPPAGSPGCWPPPCIPIDGGVTFLIAAGAAYGAKKIMDGKKKKSNLP